MKFKLVFAVAAMFAVAAATSVSADDKTDIHAVAVKLSSAFKAKNTKAVMALCTPDFEMKQQGQVIKGKQLEQLLTMQFGMTDSFAEVSMKIKKYDIHGTSATIVSDDKMIAQMTDKTGLMGPKGKQHTLVSTSHSTSDLAKIKGKWLYKSMSELSSTQLLDGKPVGMPGTPPPGPPAPPPAPRK